MLTLWSTELYLETVVRVLSHALWCCGGPPRTAFWEEVSSTVRYHSQDLSKSPICQSNNISRDLGVHRNDPDIHWRQVALSSQLRYQLFSRALSRLFLSETEKAAENRLESAVVYIRKRQVALSSQRQHSADGHVMLGHGIDITPTVLTSPRRISGMRMLSYTFAEGR